MRCATSLTHRWCSSRAMYTGAEEPPGHVQPKTPGCLHQGARPKYPRSIPSAKRHKGPGSLGSAPTLVRSGARLHKRTGTHTKAACLVEGTYSPVAPPLPAHRSLYFILLDSTAMPSHCLLYHGEDSQKNDRLTDQPRSFQPLDLV